MDHRKLLLVIVIATSVIQANSLRIDSNVEPPTKASESAADAPNAEALTLVIHKHPPMSKLRPVKVIERSDDDVVVIRSNRPKRRPQTRNRRPSQFRSKIKHLASGGSPPSFGGFKDYGGSKDYGSSPRFPPFPTKHYGEPPRASNKYKRGPKPPDTFHSQPPSTKYKNKKSKKKPTTAYGPPTAAYSPSISEYSSPSNFQQVDPPFAQSSDTYHERPLQTLQQQHNNFPSYSIDTVHAANNFYDGETAKVKQSFDKYHRDLASKYPNLNGNLPRDVESFHEQSNFQNEAQPLNNYPLEAGSSFNSQKTSYGYPVRNQGTPTLSFNPNIVTTHLNGNQKPQKNQNANQQNNHYSLDQNLNPESNQFGNYESNVNHFVNHPEPEQHQEPNNYRGNQNSRPNNNEFNSNQQNHNSRPVQREKPQQNQFSNHNLNGSPSGSYNLNFAPAQQNANSQNSNSNFPKLPSRYEQTDFSTPTRTNPNQNQYVNEFTNYNEVSESQSVQNRVPNRPNSVFNKFNNFDYDFGKNKGNQNSGPEETEEEDDENVDFVFSDSRNTRGRATTSTTTTTVAPTTTTRRPKYGKRKRPVKVSQNHNLDTDDLREAFTESTDNQEINTDFHEVALSSDDFVSPFDSQRKKKRKQNQYLHEIPSTLKTARTEQEALRQALGDDFELVSVHKSLEKSAIDADPFDFQRKSDDFVVSSDLRFGEVSTPNASRPPASFWNGDFNNFPRNHRFV